MPPRSVCWAGALLLAGLPLGAETQGEPPVADRPWYERCLVGLEVGPTGAQFGFSDPHDARYAARFDGGEIVRRSAAAHGEYLVAWARDGDFAYYDSQLLPKPPGLGTRDPLREAVAAARPLRLPVIAYCVVQQAGHLLAAHPEWAMRGSDGRNLGRFCFRSGYREFMLQLLDEQLACGVDGFHVDMLDQGFGPPYGCWCDACRKAFAAQYDRPLPAGPTWDEDWDRMLEFRYQASAEFERALAAHVRAARPEATVDFNYHGNLPFSWEVGQRPVQHAGNGDFVTGETGAWGFSPLTVGLNAEFYRAATPGRRPQVAMQRGVRGYHDQTTRPLADLRWELLTLLSHGAFVTMVDKTAFDGGLDAAAYERIGEAFADALRVREHFGQQPVYEAGIWFSARSRDWIGREQCGPWSRSFLGAHKALAYEHIPWGVVLDENVDRERLSQFAVVLLPNVGILSEEHVALLARYVEGGGRLIVTGLSGCYDRLGRLQSRSALEDLVGARFVRALPTEDNWYRFAEPWERARPDSPLLVAGPAAVYEPGAAAAIGELWQPARTTRQQAGAEGLAIPMSAERPVGPAVLLHRRGSGAVLTFAGSPDWAAASEHPVVETRRLLGDAVRAVHPRPRLRIEAPAHVQAVVSDDPAARELRVHLLAYQAPPQTMPPERRPYSLPPLMEDLPLYRAVIALAEPPRSVAAVRDPARARVTGSRVEVRGEDVHETVVIGYE
jgi:hypothetical protein